MANPKLDPQKVAEVKRLLARGYTYRLIAEMADVGLGTVSHVASGVHDGERDRIDEYAAFHREKFRELKERFDKWIGNTAKLRKPPSAKKSKRKRRVLCNDLHAPFHNERVFAEFIARERGIADEVIVGGDVMDMWNFSRYDKVKRKFQPVEEFQSGQNIYNTLSENFAVVRVLTGSNHHDRLLKYLISRNVPVDIIEFLRLAYPGFPDPQSKMIADLPNVSVLEVREHGYAEFPWLAQVDDVVITHAEKYSKIPNKAVGDVIQWLKASGEQLGLVAAPFRVVCQCHTHQAGKTWNDFGIVGIESGCMAMTPDYAADPKLRGARPSILGYTVLESEDGKTDVNASNFIQL